MAFMSSMNVVGSGLTAQQLRLDIISENVTNSQTTRTEEGGAYRRKMVVFQAEGDRSPFQAALDRARGRAYSGLEGGVRVAQIVEDPSDLKLVYDPTHPDANADGYVELPNVDMIKEITDGALEIMNDVSRLKVIQLWAGKTVESKSDFDAIYNYVKISQKCGFNDIAKKYANIANNLANQSQNQLMKQQASELIRMLN